MELEKLSIIQNRKNPVILDKLSHFIFFPNNKVAQVSIARIALADRAIIRKDDENLWRQKFSEIDSKYFSRAFTFTVVRNPYDRAVSAFTYLKGIGKIDQRLNFSGFCSEVLQHQGTSFDPHFDPQSDGLFLNGKMIPEFAARFESLEDDWCKIAIEIEAPRTLPHANKSKRRGQYADYYDDFSRELITELYADYLRNFNYEFETKKRSFWMRWITAWREYFRGGHIVS